MILTFKDYTITGTPQEIKEFIEMVETTATLSTYLSDVVIENSQPIMCPNCYSMRVKSLYETINCDGSNKRLHYICEDCHKEFDLPD